MTEHSPIRQLHQRCRSYAGFDTETTGVDPTEARIVSWALVVGMPDETGDFQPLQLYGGLINPGVEIPEDASAVHGITLEKLFEHEAPPPEVAIPEILQLLEDAILPRELVVFNAAFDLTLLAHEAARVGCYERWERIAAELLVIDPLVIDRKVNKYRKGPRKLARLCELYGVRLDDWHDAGADALAAAWLAHNMLTTHDEIPRQTDELHRAQVAWAAQDWESFKAWLVRRGEKPREEGGVWPYRPPAGPESEEDEVDEPEGPTVTLTPASKPGFFRVEASDEIDPVVLNAYGARRGRSSDETVLPARAGDLALLESAGIRVKALVSPETQRSWKLDRHLSRAKDIRKEADHPSWPLLDGHQKVGVAFLASRDRGLLSFSPGLGKSGTAIVATEIAAGLPALVVAPLTLLGTWKHEINTWAADKTIHNLRETEPGDGWNIINPEATVLNKLDPRRFKTLILDESVLYKSREAKRTKTMKKLADKIPRVWMLSGSPITHFADDLWAQLNILHPQWFNSYWRFARQWTHVVASPWGDKVAGNKDPKGLRSYLQDIMLTRTPEEVPVLPDSPIETIHVDLTKKQIKELENARDNFEVNGVAIANVLAQLTRMAQVVSYPPMLGIDDPGGKLAALKELVQWAEPPLLVWCWFRESVAAVEEALVKAGLKSVYSIHGGTTPKKREKAIEGFQSGRVQALVLQISTGRFGLSLTRAKTAIFYDRSFSLDDWVQATARVRRRSSPAPVPTYVLDGGWTDRSISVALKRKLRSVTDLGVSDLLAHMR